MPGATRKGTDAAGGPLARGSSNVYVNGKPWSRKGDLVSSHGKPPHSSPVMAKGSSTVFVNGIPACRKGDPATCGHPATGSSNVFAGG